MDQEEKYHVNLEKLYVHNVYESISTNYEEFLNLGRANGATIVDEINKDSGAFVNTVKRNGVNGCGEVGFGEREQRSFKSKGPMYRAWPKVKKFILKLEPGSLIADVGCGEGKYLNLNGQIFSIGCDRSSSLCKLAAAQQQQKQQKQQKQQQKQQEQQQQEQDSRGPNQIVVCDNLRLPFRSDLFDAVVSIGVIHHFSSAGRRVKAVKELNRVLRPGGRIMIYVWALEQHLRKVGIHCYMACFLN